ncbi:MAG: TIGR02281 family clan AA aspartic protease [Burkholderiaceae bacterium]
MNRKTSTCQWLVAGALLCAMATTANAQSVAFSGMLGDKALLVINGQAKGVAVGATLQGVKLVRIDGASAQIEVGGKTQSLHLGGVAVVAGDTGGGTSGSRIVLPAGSGGHYAGLGSINGHPIQFVVDTGATTVAMGADVATQLGLDPKSSTAVAAMTANGAVSARVLTLNSVRVGDVTVYNVEAMVMPQSMPIVLLGNSFLSHFQMHSDSNSLVLDKKN